MRPKCEQDMMGPAHILKKNMLTSI